jgi:hypothetical protein
VIGGGRIRTLSYADDVVLLAKEEGEKHAGAAGRIFEGKGIRVDCGKDEGGIWKRKEGERKKEMEMEGEGAGRGRGV